MRIRYLRADDEPEMNLSPLIDLVLCLIFFFVVTTTFDARSVLKLLLPEASGEPGAGRYTDVWARIDGAWRCVAADVTRC